MNTKRRCRCYWYTEIAMYDFLDKLYCTIISIIIIDDYRGFPTNITIQMCVFILMLALRENKTLSETIPQNCGWSQVQPYLLMLISY